MDSGLVDANITDTAKKPYVDVSSYKDKKPVDILMFYFKRRLCEFTLGMVLLFFG